MNLSPVGTTVTTGTTHDRAESALGAACHDRGPSRSSACRRGRRPFAHVREAGSRASSRLDVAEARPPWSGDKRVAGDRRAEELATGMMATRGRGQVGGAEADELNQAEQAAADAKESAEELQTQPAAAEAKAENAATCAHRSYRRSVASSTVRRSRKGSRRRWRRCRRSSPTARRRSPREARARDRSPLTAVRGDARNSCRRGDGRPDRLCDGGG